MKRPFDNAAWIWHQSPCVDLVNKFIQARTCFRLARIPRRTEILITADSSYRLFVNGRRVCQGPARGFQSAWPFDRVDIAPFLQKGANAVAVLAHNLGIHNAKYLHTGWGGLVVEGRVGGLDLSTGAAWKVRRSPGHLRTQARISVQTDFQEHFDARLDDGNWTRAEYAAADWDSPLSAFPTYVDPWPDFSERGVANLVETILPARRLVAVGAGRANGLEENVVLTHFGQSQHWRPASAPLQRGGALNVPAVQPGRVAAYCLDFGHEVVGYPILEISGGRGGEIADILLCEVVLPGGTPHLCDPRRDVNGAAYGHRLLLRRGLTRHEVYFYTGFRYLIITLRGSRQPLRLKVSVRNIAHPLDPQAGFHSADARVNRIYRAAALSLKCCLQDALVDCPAREQGQWWGLRGATNSALYLLKDTRVIARGLRQIGMQTARNGLVYPVAPSMLHNWILPEIAWTWVINLGDYYEWTGDLSVFRDAAGAVRSVLAFTEAEVQRGRGLVPSTFRGYAYRLGLSDSRLYRSGAALYALTHNLACLRALQTAARLWQAGGQTAEARIVRGRARRLERRILRCFRAKTFPYFHDSLSPQFKPVSLPAPEFYFPMLSAVLLEGYAGAHRRELAEHLWNLMHRVGVNKFKPAPAALRSPLLALYREGYRRELVEYIREYWGIWVEARGLTTVPEHWWFDANNPPGAGGAFCHAWATFPIDFLAIIILGIQRKAVGWKTMRFQPDFSAVSSASGCVPTPLGRISAEWLRQGDRVQGRLSVPAGMTAMIEVGGRKARRTGPFAEKFDIRLQG